MAPPHAHGSVRCPHLLWTALVGAVCFVSGMASMGGFWMLSSSRSTSSALHLFRNASSGMKLQSAGSIDGGHVRPSPSTVVPGIIEPNLTRDLEPPPPRSTPYNFTKYSMSNKPGYMSKSGQDKWVDEILGRRGRLFVVESGAHDAERISNSLFLETHRHWGCLLVEPNPIYAERIRRARRKCWILHGGLSTTHEPTTFQLILASHTSKDVKLVRTKALNELQERLRASSSKHKDKELQLGHSGEIVTVAAYPLHMVMEKVGVRTVDYWSLDTEGSETDILAHTDFTKISVGLVTIENGGYFGRSLTRTGMQAEELLRSNGFQHISQLNEDSSWANLSYFKERKFPLPPH